MRRLSPLWPALALGLASCFAAARAAELRLEVSGLSSTEGEVLVAVYAGAEQWLKAPAVLAKVKADTARDGRLQLRIDGLPDDVPLAVSLFHDRNGNGRMDRNPMGMPLEPFAFSNQAQGAFGPPPFSQAQLPAGTTQHAIQLP